MWSNELGTSRKEEKIISVSRSMILPEKYHTFIIIVPWKDGGARPREEEYEEIQKDKEDEEEEEEKEEEKKEKKKTIRGSTFHSS
ncbi:hypothetical protein HZH66_008510 [Vespula vulgaris]|uniref:Uncharacterized protein n=1 Tax=Vespula vulgaris TaxID=7454 RepID=A0A834JQY4_VESVU|nr:hypothetical protein HZH66_008510 [Vespula vulgaris]